jgi:hypothetical protein
VQADDSIVVQTDPNNAPSAVKLYQAHVSEANGRDFRLETIGQAWSSTTLSSVGNGVYVAQVPEPTDGWTGFFVELIYKPLPGFDFYFTTEIKVIPDYLPFICDFDRDGDVDIEDLSVMASKWLEEDGYPADVSPRMGDGIVNIQDYSILNRNWTSGI